MWLGKEESRLSAAEGHPPHRPPAGCFSFTLDDMGPTNGYWPYYRCRPFIFQGHIASLGKAFAGRGGHKVA